MKWTQLKSNRLLVDSSIAFFILSTPFIFYSYLCFPEGKNWETYFFNFSSNFYNSVSTFVWVFNQKFIWILLMILWYFTSKDWWKNAILAPISMLLYQIIFLFNDELRIKDIFVLDKFIVIPICFSICLFLYFIRKKISFYAKALDLKEQIEKSIQECKEEISNND